jgi:hypothetical protein
LDKTGRATAFIPKSGMERIAHGDAAAAHTGISVSQLVVGWSDRENYQLNDVAKTRFNLNINIFRKERQ